jgi:cation transport ATPase
VTIIVINMEATTSEYDSPLKKARRIRILFLTYVIVFPLITFILPENGLAVDFGINMFSWLLFLLMPTELLLIYGFYLYAGKRFGLENLQGLAIPMYVFSTIPSIYAFIIGFLNSTLRLLAITIGLMFSLTGFWLASMLLSRCCEDSTAYKLEQLLKNKSQPIQRNFVLQW